MVEAGEQDDDPAEAKVSLKGCVWHSDQPQVAAGSGGMMRQPQVAADNG